VWALSQGTENKIDFFEWKIFQKIFGPTQSKGVWRIRYNDEIYKMYKDVALSTIHAFKDINVGWPRKNGTTSYCKEGTRKLFWRRKASGKTMK
jgi:hypothetical protein